MEWTYRWEGSYLLKGEEGICGTDLFVWGGVVLSVVISVALSVGQGLLQALVDGILYLKLTRLESEKCVCSYTNT